MPVQKFTIKSITPMFMTGADKTQPEFRASAVRGQLRYWFRAITGATVGNDLDQLRARESAVFGSTGQGSSVIIRCFERDTEYVKTPLVPHSEKALAKAFAPDSKYELQLAFRPGLQIKPELRFALHLWFFIGGIGKRSRRVMGAFNLPGEYLSTLKTPPITPDTFAIYLKKAILFRAVGDPESLPNPFGSGLPQYPTLHPAHSRITLSKEGFDTWEAANKALFDVLRSNPYRDNPVFGGISPRRSSPLIAQIRQFQGGKYHLVLTAMRSKSPDSSRNPLDWKLLSRFLDEFESEQKGIRIWGTL